MLKIAVLSTGTESIIRNQDLFVCGDEYNYSGPTTSDHITLMRIFEDYSHKCRGYGGDLDEISRYCHDWGIDRVVLEERRSQINELRQRLATNPRLALRHTIDRSPEAILPALVRAFHSNLASGVTGQDFFHTVPDGEKARITRDMRTEMHTDTVGETLKCMEIRYMHGVSHVELEWLVDLPYFRDDDILRGHSIAVGENGQVLQPSLPQSLDSENQALIRIDNELNAEKPEETEDWL
ncbi:hypothetical protein NLG97_g5557 [Lecanicillium saksenae]|uniref:Uncharacterized protein n=1 Tax=Lecanicillium saksenae TaxID=468837 RepID=A0ACC1QTT9_9HYPO|nr:hypothetical protein NLG97_g5557 [Lecanicillium saksenae]